MGKNYIDIGTIPVSVRRICVEFMVCDAKKRTHSHEKNSAPPTSSTYKMTIIGWN